VQQFQSMDKALVQTYRIDFLYSTKVLYVGDLTTNIL